MSKKKDNELIWEVGMIMIILVGTCFLFGYMVGHYSLHKEEAKSWTPVEVIDKKELCQRTCEFLYTNGSIDQRAIGKLNKLDSSCYCVIEQLQPEEKK